MRRALTMIEMLLALSLLTGVMLAVAGWTRVSASLAVDATGPAQRDASVEAVFRLIQDDLLVGDMASNGAVDIDGQALKIVTRRRGAHSLMGPVTHRYRVDPGRKQLTQQMSGLGSRVTRRVLLHDIRRCRWELDDTGTVLDVTLVATDGREWSRRFRL